MLAIFRWWCLEGWALTFLWLQRRVFLQEWVVFWFHLFCNHQTLFAVVRKSFFDLCCPQIIDSDKRGWNRLGIWNEQLELKDDCHEIQNWVPSGCQDRQMHFTGCHVDVIGVSREEGRDQVAGWLEVDLRCSVWVCIREDHLENEPIVFVLAKKYIDPHFYFDCRLCGWDLTISLHHFEVLRGLLGEHVSDLCDSNDTHVGRVAHFFICFQISSQLFMLITTLVVIRHCFHWRTTHCHSSVILCQLHILILERTLVTLTLHLNQL